MAAKVSFSEENLGCRSHFLDSGSFTLWRLAKEYALVNGTGPWAYYDTPEFWAYMEDYATFVKKYEVAIDHYANIDVIPNAELTLRNQEALEQKYDLNPVPVVHYTCDLKWLRYYMDKGYRYIALGGLVGSHGQDACQNWIDRAFDIVCDQPSRLPKVRIHGFGVTSYNLLLRYPWWSVDSSSWTKSGGFGNILVPHKRSGKFVFTEQPYAICTSVESPSRKVQGRHLLTLSRAERAVVLEWLDYIGVPLGQNSPEGEVIEYGVINRHSERKAANLLFYEELRKSLPKYPWPFHGPRRVGFGLVK